MRPPLAGDVAAAFALDAGALATLKEQAKASPKAALSAAASQFEALFVQMLLKSMREALPQDGMLQSDTSKMYTSMFDQQIAVQMSRRGIGLKEMLERQLAPAVAGAKGSAAATAPAADSVRPITTGSPSGVQEYWRATNPATNVRPITTGSPSGVQADDLRHQAMTRAGGTAPTRATDPATELSGHVLANVRSFIAKMRPHAEAAARAIGVPADFLLAQAGLETGWGRSQPKAADGTASHNLFGIKAGQSWNGATAVAATTEYVAGAIVRTVDRFRAYHSYTEAFQDFARLITGNARYAKAVAGAGDPVAYARGLQHGGYATDPQYADKLVRAIRLVASHTARVEGPAAQVMARAAVNPLYDA